MQPSSDEQLQNCPFLYDTNHTYCVKEEFLLILPSSSPPPSSPSLASLCQPGIPGQSHVSYHLCAVKAKQSLGFSTSERCKFNYTFKTYILILSSCLITSVVKLQVLFWRKAWELRFARCAPKENLSSFRL